MRLGLKLEVELRPSIIVYKVDCGYVIWALRLVYFPYDEKGESV